MRLRLFLLVTGLLVVTACTSTSKTGPLPVPDLEIEVRHRTRTTFSTRDKDLVRPSPEDFDSIMVGFYALERIPVDLLDPVTDHANLFLQSGEGDIFLPAPRLMAGSRVGFGPAAEAELLKAIRAGSGGRWVEIGRATGIVAQGTTASIELRKRKPVVVPHLLQEVYESLFVDLTETSDGSGFIFTVGVRRVASPEPALPTAGLSPDESDRLASEKEAEEQAGVRFEGFVTDLDVSGVPHAIVAVLPATFLDEEIGAVALTIFISKPPAVYSPARMAHDDQVKDFDIDRQFREAELEIKALGSPVAPQVWTGLENALDALSDPDIRRRRLSLAWVSHETGAWLAEDVALTAEDQSMNQIVERLIKSTKDLPRPLVAEQLGLALEKATWAMLFELLGNREPPPGIEGVIIRHSGEVGRHSSVLEEMVDAAESLEALRKEIRTENLRLLEDSSPAVRVRAYDWLSLFGTAPPGFDPLAPRKERREVMNRFLDENTRKVGAK